MSAEALPEYLTTDQVSALTTLSKSSLERMRSTGEGIPFIKMGSGRTCRVIYAKSDVIAFLESNKHRSTSEYGR